jgi:hypothetical protein
MAIESNGQKGKFAYSGGREEEQQICNGSELERIIGHGGEFMHFDLEDSELMRLSVRELNHKLAVSFSFPIKLNYLKYISSRAMIIPLCRR